MSNNIIDNLWKLTVPELRKKARQMNISNVSKMTKTPLIIAISEKKGIKGAKRPVELVKNKNILDQYFTKEKVAKFCIKKLNLFINKHNLADNKTQFIEPSVGSGTFFRQLNRPNKISLDIDPNIRATFNVNFYNFQVPKNSIVFGNPPFGHRGEDALRFINHARNSQVVAFILPMFFNSIGKGSARFRVKGKKLAKTFFLKPDSFMTPEGKIPQIYTVFQIWVNKNLNIKEERSINWYEKSASDYEKIAHLYTICTNKSRLCGLDKIGKCDLYISSTFYKNPPKFVRSFEEVEYGSGIGIKFKSKKHIKIFEQAQLQKYSNRATNGVFHIGISSLRQLMRDKKLV